MDIDKLVNLTQEGQNELEEKVLRYCNPRKIARKLMSDLETSATKAAKEGKQEAETSFTIWWIRTSYSKHDWQPVGKTDEQKAGPLVDCDDKRKLSEVLLNMVRKYVDDDIQLALRDDDDPPCDSSTFDGNVGYISRTSSEGTFLVATVSWDAAAVARKEKAKEAFEKLRTAAEQGDADLQYKLGSMYETGQGVPKDNVKAIEWFRKAAAQGHAEAKDAIAVVEARIAKEKAREEKAAAERTAAEERARKNREAKEAKEKSVREATEAWEKRAREAQETEEKRAREVKEEEERKARETREKEEARKAKEAAERAAFAKKKRPLWITGVVFHICLTAAYSYILWGTDIIRSLWIADVFKFIQVLPFAGFSLAMGIISVIFLRKSNYGSGIWMLLGMFFAQSITSAVWDGRIGILAWRLIFNVVIALVINFISAIPGTILAAQEMPGKRQDVKR